MLYKIVKISGNKLVSAVADRLHLVEYKVGEFVKSPFEGYALFATHSPVAAMNNISFKNVLNAEGFIVDSEGDRYAIYTCEVIRNSKLNCCFNFDFVNPPWGYSSVYCVGSSTTLVEQIKLLEAVPLAQLKEWFDVL
jgi:hypothetical protein